MKRKADAAERNRGPIAEVLATILPPQGLVLEIASGTGQHTRHFAERFPELIWQPTDRDPLAFASIDAWGAEAPACNVRHALELDVTSDSWPVDRADAVIAINMLHIAPWKCCEGLFAGASRLLRAGAPLLLYGPFAVDGVIAPESNQRFDERLRAQDARWGLRDVRDVTVVATSKGFAFTETVQMPANNLSLVFIRQ